MRFKAIDTFRGVAAIMVILFHMQHLSVLAGSVLIRKSDIFVDFFFVLSGFVITHSYFERIRNFSTIKKFIIKRARRLYPLHFFTLFLVLVFEIARFVVDRYFIVLANPIFKSNNLFSFLSNFTLTQSLGLFDRVTWNEPSWSISVEFYIYITWALSLLLFKNEMKLFYFVSLSLITWFIVIHEGNIIYNYNFGFIRCGYGFLIGMVAYKLNAKFFYRVSYRNHSLIETAALALTMVFVCLFTHSFSWLMPIWFGALIVVFSREGGIFSIILRSKHFEFLGALSYSYYLNHFIVLTVMDLLLFKLIKLPHANYSEWFYIIVCLSSIHLLSIFTHRHVEFAFKEKTIVQPNSSLPISIVHH